MIKILWLSMYAPVSFSSSAGSQTFNFYFKKFWNDPEYDIKLISCGLYREREKVEKELSNVDHHIIYWNRPKKSVFSKLLNIESKLSPWNASANLMANTDVFEMLAKAKELRKKGFCPDIVVLEWTPIVLLASRVRALFPDSKIIASEHDVTYIGFERKADFHHGIKKLRWKQRFRWEKKREIEELKKCDLVLPHNPDNIACLKDEGISENKMMWLVPYYHSMLSCQRNSNRRDMLFFGAMSRPENYLSALWFIDHVMPLLSDLDIRFVVVGGNPPEELTAHESEKIHVTGYIESVDDYFSQAMCLVAPLVLGAGIKVKIIEGLSSGIPVLTNGLGIEGIDAEDGKEYFHCEKPEDYEKIIRQLKENKIDEASIEENAKKMIRRIFSPTLCQIDYSERMKALCQKSDK